MKYPALIAALLIAIPVMADDAPATQPATQPAAKPRARLNDEPPRRKVPLVVKKPEDVWMLLPKELRPVPLTGKVSDELAEKIEAWLKENGKALAEEKVQFVMNAKTEFPYVSNDAYDPEALIAQFKFDGKILLSAPVSDKKELLKKKAVKYNGEYEKQSIEVAGFVKEVKLQKADDVYRLSVSLKESQIVSVKIVSSRSL